MMAGGARWIMLVYEVCYVMYDGFTGIGCCMMEDEYD